MEAARPPRLSIVCQTCLPMQRSASTMTCLHGRPLGHQYAILHQCFNFSRKQTARSPPCISRAWRALVCRIQRAQIAHKTSANPKPAQSLSSLPARHTKTSAGQAAARLARGRGALRLVSPEAAWRLARAQCQPQTKRKHAQRVPRDAASHDALVFADPNSAPCPQTHQRCRPRPAPRAWRGARPHGARRARTGRPSSGP
jgi:hypothetical protein